MSETPLIQAVRFLGPVECSECGTNLYKKGMEYEVTELGQDGQPLMSDNITQIKGVCPKCGREYELEKDGMYYRIKDRAPERYKYRVPKESTNLYDAEDESNPFII